MLDSDDEKKEEKCAHKHGHTHHEGGSTDESHLERHDVVEDEK